MLQGPRGLGGDVTWRRGGLWTPRQAGLCLGVSAQSFLQLIQTEGFRFPGTRAWVGEGAGVTEKRGSHCEAGQLTPDKRAGGGVRLTEALVRRAGGSRTPL